jgi:tetratricopeptide (TPR) repeat protein
MPMLDGFLMTPMWVDTRFGKWDAILRRPEPGKELPGTHLMWRYSRVIAYAGKGDLEKAQTEQSAYATESSVFPPDTMFGSMNKAVNVLPVANEVVAARVAAAQGKQEEAIKHWQVAAEAQDKLNYTEPPDWYYPVRESLGAAYLKIGKPYDAEMTFREDLRQNPRNPRSLYGLREALAAQHLDMDAAWVDRQFQVGWKNADVELNLSDF